MINILVTGSSGFLGKEVVAILNENKFNLNFLSNSKFKKKAHNFLWAPLSSKCKNDINYYWCFL